MAVLGLGKTLFNSSVCYMENSENLEILLTERLTRKKASGAWPAAALNQLRECYKLDDLLIFENRDVDDPAEIETKLNSQFPFFESLEKQKLHTFSRHFNPNVKFATHHMCHASAAAFMSPFERTLILVIDGAGNRHPEAAEFAEERSVYQLENGRLKCVEKKLQRFKKSVLNEHYFSEGLGSFYEKASEFIFNSKRSAGKVMGLAALGQAQKVTDIQNYLAQLDWQKQYAGKSKTEWEVSPHMAHYRDVAADVQSYFEEDYIGYIQLLKEKYQDYDNLIIAGGCALNCTSNMKLFNLGVFSQIYVPPFPGDESISLGAAVLAWQRQGGKLSVNPFERQHGYFGPASSVPTEQKIASIFTGYEIVKPASITDYTAEILARGEIVGWYQGRSESGPRALGNRSILARPDKPGIKDFLNTRIKFRESFRPYGCSTLFEMSHKYFSVPARFDNPYMSFATRVRAPFVERLKEVSHVDGTSRMQTVRSTQNPRFYDLIQNFGLRTDLFCLLNTSLNVMGEPIVESLSDAKNFLDQVPVCGLAAGDCFIRRK